MPTRSRISNNIRTQFHETLQGLADAEPIMKPQYVQRLLSQVDVLTDSLEGQRLLYDQIPGLTEAGVFHGGPWEDPGRMVPALVVGSLQAGGQTTLMEVLSELRILAIVEGRIAVRGFSQKKARAFLEEALVGCLELMFPDRATSGEESATQRKVRHLMELLTDRVPVEELKEELATEVELICLQRPIVTDRVFRLLAIVRDHVMGEAALGDTTGGAAGSGAGDQAHAGADRRLALYLDAAFGPSEAARDRTPEEYEAFLSTASNPVLEEEAIALGRSMKQTGLGTAYHAIFIRRVASRPKLLTVVLGLDASGTAELEKHGRFVSEIIEWAIHPVTARACYGLGRLLDRSVLSQQPVRSGLESLLTVELHPELAAAISSSRPEVALEPAQLLLADCLGVLGQPLGVGQGGNPTCQSARGISLWSRHAPGKLLGMIRSVAGTNDMSMRFEGQMIVSSEVGEGLAKEFDYDLDAVSAVLVPHLDRIYNHMMTRASYRGEDPHKWVNPAMYGHWIPTGFLSAYDYATNTIRDYDRFLRTFYATHHPEFNRGHDLAYPNPVGVFLTSSTGALIGFHAVSVLRVREVKGQMRVYLFNPNNEGRQRWHADIRPTVAGNGERPGESSLPFHQFASRVYAFHFSPSDVGDLEAVSDDAIERVTAIARTSWGKSYHWAEPAPPPP